LNLQTLNICASTKTIDYDVWHKRFEHPSDKVLNSLLNFPRKCIRCDICKLTKQTRLPFSLSISKSEASFELIHSDVWGPAPTNSYNGFKYL